MAATGYIPVIGWFGKGIKGAKAINNTARASNAAAHALDAYRTKEAMSFVSMGEKGIYGLIAANEAKGYLTGTDLLGEEVSEDSQGLANSLSLAGILGVGRLVRSGNVGVVSSNRGTGDVNRLISGNPGNPTTGDPTKLGKNLLESMGVPRSTSWKGYQAQHVIPSQLNKHPVIKKIGMDMNDSTNGIFLPIPSDDVSSLSRHRGFHGVYNNVVRKQLDKMDVNQDLVVLEKQVYELQQKLRKGVENGLPLYKTKITNIEEFYKSGQNHKLPIWNRGGGATEELWERWLSK